MTDQRVANASAEAPIRDCQCLVVHRETPISARVPRLFAGSRPAAVVRGIGSVIVDALQAVERAAARSSNGIWTWTHVGVERLKGLLPSFTECNASASVVAPRLIAWVGARLADAQPHHVLRRSRSCRRHSVSSVRSPNNFTFQTSATAGLAVSKKHRLNGLVRAAFASAFPINGRPDRGALNNCQASELLSSQIKHCRHMFHYTAKGIC